MKKIVTLAIISLFTFPIASIAADRAPDATINAAISMIEPGYCDFATVTTPNSSKVQIWYDNAKKAIISCYKEANKNTSILPKNNPAYAKCLIADFVVKANVSTLKNTVDLEGTRLLDDLYFSNQEFQNRFANVTKDIHGQENNEYRENMRKILHTANDKLRNSCSYP